MKECGADANAASEDGTTAAMYAAVGGFTSTVVTLVRTVLWKNDGCVLCGRVAVESRR